jgi:hypothetical protein
MKVLKKAAFYFVLVWALTWGVRFMVYEGIRSNRNGLFDKFNRIFHKKNAYDALFIGSSRTECHFNPRIFDSITGYHSYNIGVSGSNNSFTYGIYKAYLSQSKAPGIVIMNVDFHFAHESSDTIYEFPRFFPYLDNPVLFKELQKRDRRFYLFKYFPAYSLAFMGDRYLNVSLRGYSGKESLYDKQCYKGFQPVNPLNYKMLDSESVSPYKGRILKENTDYLDSILRLTKKNNSKLYLVVSPTHIKGTRRLVNHEEILAQFKQLAEANNVVFMDYTKDPLCYKDAYFADFYHMKKKGADLFSTIFSCDFAAKFPKNSPQAVAR